MTRFSKVVAAGVACAMIVITTATLDAVGADKPPTAKAPDLVAEFAACLRDRGVQVPNLQRFALERWLKGSDLPVAKTRACKTALADPTEKRAAAAPGADEVAACLRAHGFDPPADPVALKRWITEQHRTTVTRALKECGVGPAPAPGCGPKDEPAKDEPAKVEPEE